ncbi:hypothetical protein JC2156_04210 [Weissella koreensis KCTC 3621]|uniref:baseplate J/gp47 family protein n=1 Tax=Weissella koreensis TaxID=165096 RepID=UPI00026F3642|nr:baseplate J/gp47 family protein [Weissella koreensis]EJF33711.1 hypothetical protein JC2156_05250 [Weissella koreensis KCTC 3621]EJF34113.1 hypothetical protein JC2156_04210 [Weissella koreensis KCTC 3621]
MTTPNDLLSELQKHNFQYFMDIMLERVPVNMDVREGSVIYDALAPVSWALAEQNINMVNVLLDTYTQTAIGDALDWRGAERGIVRNIATKARVKASFKDMEGNPYNPEVGTRFSSITNDQTELIYYQVSENIVDGQAELEAEAAGGNGNYYLGQILPITNMNGLGYAEIIEITVPAREAENDDDYRARILDYSSVAEYGGNVADYLKFVGENDDIGAVQIYPTWNGGGTVKVVILDNDLKPASDTLVKEEQEILDPIELSGDGYGIAPIGHTVTVVAPEIHAVAVDLTIETATGIDPEDVANEVKGAVKDYIENEVKLNWANATDTRIYTMIIYRSQITAAILKNTTSIINVQKVLINGKEVDEIIKMDAKKQEVPITGEVTVHA